MRLFVAVLFNDEVLSALEDIKSDMRADGISGTYTARDNLHLTLAFIGDHDDPRRVIGALERVSFKPFEIELEGMGNFGNILWAGISAGRSLDWLARRVREELEADGIPFDKKRFSPHITLARKVSDPSWRTDVPERVMSVRRVSLMLSERGPQGMIYTEIGGVDCR